MGRTTGQTAESIVNLGSSNPARIFLLDKLNGADDNTTATNIVTSSSTNITEFNRNPGALASAAADLDESHKTVVTRHKELSNELTQLHTALTAIITDYNSRFGTPAADPTQQKIQEAEKKKLEPVKTEAQKKLDGTDALLRNLRDKAPLPGNPRNDEASDTACVEAEKALANNQNAPLHNIMNELSSNGQNKIDTTELELDNVIDAYKNDKLVHATLTELKTSIEAFNSAVEKLKLITDKMVTPKAAEFYREGYEKAHRAASTRFAEVSAKLNNEIEAQSITRAFTDSEHAGELKQLADQFNALQLALLLKGQKIPTLGGDSGLMKVAKLLPQSLTDKVKAYEEGKKPNLNQQFSGKRLVLVDVEKKKYEEQDIMLKDKTTGKNVPFDLSLKEMERAIIQFNAQERAKWEELHGNKPCPHRDVTMTKDWIGGGYTIHAGLGKDDFGKDSERLDKVLKTMQEIRDLRPAPPAAGVTEAAIPNGSPTDVNGVQEAPPSTTAAPNVAAP